MPAFNPTINNSKGVQKMGRDIKQGVSTSLSSILQFDYSDTSSVAAQLRSTGVLGVAEAYIAGHTMQDIAKALGGSVVAVMVWENAQPKQDKDLLRQAKSVNLESLERHLVKLQQSELENLNDDELPPSDLGVSELAEWEEARLIRSMKVATLADKRIQSIERVMKAVQGQLERYREKDEGSSSSVLIVNTTTTPDSMPALPEALEGVCHVVPSGGD